MASVQKVQSYLSYWFQLGKPVIFEPDGSQCLPMPIFQGPDYSPSFQQCWGRIMAHPSECFLRGTDESVADLLSEEWEIVGCARCPMPMPMPIRGIKVAPCPCADLPSWPNTDIPHPRNGVCTHEQLSHLQQRLNDRFQQDCEHLQSAYSVSPDLPKVANFKTRTLTNITQMLQEKSVPDA
jgi:hypothetical protein